MTDQKLAENLVLWFKANQRELPWRRDRDPYRIWISEIMLQQTTVTTVIPYYERFLKTFPNVKRLARAPLSEVLQLWTGLGYYSRARNLHAAAQILAKTGFPKTHAELMELPGLGPYTARAIASLAFDEPVGVLDGNVIRILSRVLGERVEHWTPKGRAQLQTWADQLAQKNSHQVNQAMMELGATVCSPKAYRCVICPWFDPCKARRTQTVDQLPLPKPRRSTEVWVWKPVVLRRGQNVALIQNDYAPFLKGQWIFPGEVTIQSKRPKEFDLRHGITHHDIYVCGMTKKKSVAQTKSATEKPRPTSKGKMKWVPITELTEWNPSILLQKVLDVAPS